MYIVLGVTGHVGAEVAKALLASGETVTVVTRDATKAMEWENKGARVEVVDILYRQQLKSVFKAGKRAFLLNPPAPVSTDTDVEEHKTLQAIIAAIDGSGLEKIVLESTYGAGPGERCGDLSVLFDFEKALARQPIPVTVQRAAYYMSNWDEMLKPAQEGILPSMFPSDFVLPMVAPADLAQAAARFLKEPPQQTGLHYVEGPARYSIQDVANAFARALGHTVEVVTTPREQWVSAYRKLGFSETAADSYACMTGVTLDGVAFPDDPVRGATTLETYIDALVAKTSTNEKR